MYNLTCRNNSRPEVLDMLSHRFGQMKRKYSGFLPVVVSLVLIPSIIGCQKATTSTTTTPLTTMLTTTTPPPRTIVVSTSTTNMATAQTTTFNPLVRVLAEDYEQLYLQAVTKLDSTKTSGSFDYGNYWTVTVIQAGYFSTSSSGNTINYLRIDMQVAFTSGEAITSVFSGLGSIAVSSPKEQYQFDSVDSTLKVADRLFDSDSPVTGYWIFQVQGTLDPLNTVQLVFTGGQDTGTQWLFQL